jgi:hypothetical protein
MLLLAVFLVLRARWRNPVKRAMERARAEEEAREAFDASPKCVCGELAKHPAPILERTRGGWNWLRNYFAAPPSYRRRVDVLQVPVFCPAHVHVADAMMDQFIFRIRSEYSALNAKIAADAAGFEQEALMRAVAESLTETQKRSTRKSPSLPRVLPTLVRVLPARTGTDGDDAN